MVRRTLGRALQSTVARRMVIVFVVCTAVPLAGLALLTVNRTTAQLDREAWTQLRRDAKSAATEAMDRLGLLQHALRIVGVTLLTSRPDDAVIADRVSALIGQGLEAVVFYRDGVPARPLRGQVAMPPLTAEQRQHLATARALIASENPAGVESRQVLLVRVATPDGQGTVAAALDHRALFGLADEDELPAWTDVCVFQAGRTLACSSGVPAAIVHQAATAASDVDLTGTTPEGAHLIRTRTVPLRAVYAADPWTVAVIRPQAVVREPLASFVGDFWKVFGLSILLVAWVTLTYVRRHLRPLDALTTATRRLARRDFDSPTGVRSGDEFEQLGDAFDTLARELKHQFAELEAFNLGTLAALARAIDAKSPWTAGHSERVTRLAVVIAEEMGLPEEEITDLRRGGLIHDIGKLGTPIQVLDKGGPLSVEEVRIMQGHAQKGVHILEPIPQYRRLLPIVGQHHERWDGKGYPAGLAGAEIARTARVLAVADACDAMQSDRPYRPGLPIGEVVAAIRRESGRQFDPDVVEAFARVMARAPATGRAPRTVA